MCLKVQTIAKPERIRRTVTAAGAAAITPSGPA
jgi:hypothetical protein